jgi:hypothetical protein
MVLDSTGHAIAVWADFRRNPGVGTNTPNQDTMIRQGL